MKFKLGDYLRVITGPYVDFSGTVIDLSKTRNMYKLGFKHIDDIWFYERELRSYEPPLNSLVPVLFEDVIFNDPATIVLWKDGSKTVVKVAEGEMFDPEKGLAMAISKKSLGNKGNYFGVFKRWLPKEDKSDD